MTTTTLVIDRWTDRRGARPEYLARVRRASDGATCVVALDYGDESDNTVIAAAVSGGRWSRR